MANEDDLGVVIAPPPPPRRSDAAFARAVADDVAARGQRGLWLWLGAPAAAVSLGAAAFLLWPTQAPTTPRLNPIAIGAFRAQPVVLAEADAEPLLGDDAWDDDFAIPALAGSSTDELLRLEKSLDAALAQQKL